MIKEEQIVSLSHWINEDTPVYANKGGFRRKYLSSIQNGDSANSEYWEFNNHLGTHIDFPKHFCENGKTSSDYPASWFWARKVYIIELSSVPNPGQLIGVNDISQKCTDIPLDAEVIILKTGFEQFRKQEIYWSQNPGYHPDLFIFLRNRFPLLRFFGFDTISLTSVLHREMGRTAHQQFLCTENPILVIEDMHLASLNKEIVPVELIIAYTSIIQADGGPVNCILKFQK